MSWRVKISTDKTYWNFQRWDEAIEALAKRRLLFYSYIHILTNDRTSGVLANAPYPSQANKALFNV
jgi:hypothetical protein